MITSAFDNKFQLTNFQFCTKIAVDVFVNLHIFKVLRQ